MRHMLRAGIGLLLIILCMPSAFAAKKSTFVVLPFSVEGPQGYAYLERSVPQMLTSRLYAKGSLEPVAAEVPSSQKPAKDEAAAEKLRASYKADYVVWGTVTVVGEDCSIDVRVRNKAGKVWHQSGEAPANQFMAAIKNVSDTINRDVFHQTPAAFANFDGNKGKINQMNPDIVVNQTTSQEVYLNPQFRYSGNNAEDDSRLRSQPLNFTSVGMEICDANNDGKNEVFILSDHSLHAYRFSNGRLDPIGEFKFPRTSECLSVRAWPTRGGKTRLVVNTVDVDTKPLASILSFDGKQFTEEAKNIKLFLNVVKLPPDYLPTLVGQKYHHAKLFQPGVYEVIKTSDGYTTSKRLDLPEDANVLNFTYLPGRMDETGADKLIVLSPQERLRVYSGKNSRLAETEEKYSGSSKGVPIPTNMPGMAQDNVTIPDMFYVPLRMLAVDLERDGKYELLVNRPMSTASTIFDRYRFFPQSEIHSLFWDGIGMNLQWKTRRIKGSVSDFTLADVNNDGILDLVACINTHPGALGVKQRKTMLVIYPLDVTQTGPGKKAHSSFATESD